MSASQQGATKLVLRAMALKIGRITTAVAPWTSAAKERDDELL